MHLVVAFGERDHQIGKVVLVPGLAAARIEGEAPDAHVLVLEHDLVADRAERRCGIEGFNIIGHILLHLVYLAPTGATLSWKRCLRSPGVSAASCACGCISPIGNGQSDPNRMWPSPKIEAAR